jgi:formylglycine-generating enzyme required for sulfatase activity
MTDSSNTLNEGFRLEEFEIKSVLGRGGFGITYLVWDHSLEKKVAIKEYFPNDWAQRLPNGCVTPLSDKTAELFGWGRNVFLNEARTLAKLTHVNILKAYRHLGDRNGTDYIVMEFVPGEDFQTYLKREGVLPAEDVRYLTECLLDGLREAHGYQIFHRDIKPENILIHAERGQPVLIDFGAARQIVQSRSAPVTAFVTPPFAPPEQYSTQAKTQGPWTDIYSISAVAYIALSGKSLPDGPGRREEDTFEPLDEEAYGDPKLCRAINAGLKISGKDRPGNINAWLDIASCRHAEAKVAPPDPGSIEKGGTELRGSNDTILRPRGQSFPQKNPQGNSRHGVPLWAMIAGGAAALLVLGFVALDPIMSVFGDGTKIVGPIGPSATRQKSATCKDCPTMVKVPAGSFKMGSGRYPTSVKVQISNSFLMSETEVTVGQYQACVNAGGCESLSSESFVRDGRLDLTAIDQPIRFVALSHVKKFLFWLEVKTGQAYRLPTEAEWEYAARAKADTQWTWGNTPRSGEANCASCGTGLPAPAVQDVKSYRANAFGLYDMQGNVWEFVSDCWTENFSSHPGNASAVSNGDCSAKTIRGGGYSKPKNKFHTPMEQVQLSTRGKFRLENKEGLQITSPALGFRVVTDIDR